MQPIHATGDILIADRHWGTRAATSYAWRSLLDAGTKLAFGSDAPVEPISPLLGIHAGRAIYLLYNGILKDKSVTGGNVLTGPVFDLLPKFDGPKVIYATANRMGARTARERIAFKQTPYALDL